MFFEKRSRSALLLVLAGLLCALPMTFDFLFLLSWAAPSAAFALLFDQERRGAKKTTSLGTGFLFSFSYLIGVYYWFFSLYPMEMMDFSPVTALSVILLAWIGISLIQALELSLAFWLYRWIAPKSPPLKALTVSALWILCEWIGELGWMGFPWARIGLSQHAFLPAIQLASLFGPYFISFLVVLVNALLALALASGRRRGALALASGRRGALIGACCVFLGNLLFGAVHLRIPERPIATIRAAVVQGNILSGEKWNGVEPSYRQYMSLTETVRDTDLLVWPESAVPMLVKKGGRAEEIYAGVARTLDAEFIAGGYYYDEAGGEHNALFLIDENGIKGEPYSKRHIVPFGEYLPMRGFFEVVFPALTRMNMISTDLSFGTSSALLDGKAGKIGGLICFDSIFQALSRESAADGAELLVLITNDSWFKDSAAIYQHNAQAVFRAVENGRYVVRAANTGLSSVISAKGKIINSLPPLKEGVIYSEVSFLDRKTLYTKIGDVILPAALLFLLFLAVFEKKRRKSDP